MNIVIINKDQPFMNFPRVFPGEKAITVSIDGRMDSRIRTPGAHVTFLENHPGGFHAGANRDNGLTASYTRYGMSGHVLFLDGDRIPYGYDPQIILRTLHKYGADALLLTCIDDNRSIAATPYMDGPVDAGCLVSEFYSCGFVLTDDAIRKVRALNGGRLFHPAFDGHWGEEDKYLGIQLHHLGLRTCFTRRIRLGGGPLGTPELHPDYAISLRTRINLMIENHYTMRNNEMYAHLEKAKDGTIIKIYDGVPQAYAL